MDCYPDSVGDVRLTERPQASPRDLSAAHDPGTPPAELARLAAHPAAEVRRAVAGNPGTPREALIELAQRYPAEVLANPVLPLLDLEGVPFFEEEALFPKALARIAALPQCPEHFLLWLAPAYLQRWSACDGPSRRSVLLAALSNDHLPRERRWGLYLDTAWTLALADQCRLLALGPAEEVALLRAAGFPQGRATPRPLDPARAQALAGLGPLGLRLTLGQRHAPPDLADAHALSSDPDLGRIARSSPTLSPERMREVLARGQERELEELAANPALPPEVAWALYRAGNRDLWRRLARAGRLPPRLAERLAEAGWLEELAQNPSTPQALLERAALEPKAGEVLAGRPGLSVALALKLCANPSVEARWRLVRNPDVPAEALRLLARDASAKVARAARRHRRGPDLGAPSRPAPR